MLDRDGRSPPLDAVQCLVLIEDEDVREPDGVEHGGDASPGAAPSASPKLLGRVQAIAKQVGRDRMAARRRYAVGDVPMIARNVRLNVPRLVKPTSRQMSLTGRSVSRSRNIERSTRRRWR